MDGSQDAFPNCFDGFAGPSFGLTKRELFAAMAMQGWLADSGGSMSSARDAARHAVDHADALIAELSKQ